MYKKLIIINLAVILLVTAAYIAVYYFINYPMQFNLWYIIQECQLQYLPAIFAVTALASYQKAQERYSELTHPYLDRRNGKGWEGRMEKAIHDVKKIYKK